MAHGLHPFVEAPNISMPTSVNYQSFGCDNTKYFFTYDPIEIVLLDEEHKQNLSIRKSISRSILKYKARKHYSTC